MVFNWFRRQFNESKQETEDKSAQTSPTQPEETPTETPTSQEQPQQVAEDYLAWAKAAYKNIQTKQKEELEEQESDLTPDSSNLDEGETAVEAQATETELAPAEDVSAVPESVIAAVEETPPVQLEVPSIPSEVVVEETKENVATDAEIAVSKAAPEPPPPPPIDANIPFWIRDDRQSRLEKLKATAIEEPKSEVKPTPTVVETPSTVVEAPSTEEIPGLSFDEGFLWSSEVLAAQGRRPEDVSFEEITWLKKLRQSLGKTRLNLINQLKAIVGQGPLDRNGVTEIESLLLQADVGVEATDYIIDALQKRLREEALPPEEAIAYLKQILRNMLDEPFQKSYKPIFVPEKESFNIWLMTGVNGAGKTTTIGKISHIAMKSGYKCLIAAADTFRAAAVEQVKVWGQRSGVEVISNPGKNTDPAAVVFDAIEAAKSRGTELLIVDTAGRLQNKKNLMEELTKIRRIIDKKAPDAIVESLLVLDATLGQNGLRQAQVFSEAAKLSGVVLTKLDGTAKGGVALAIVQQMGLPIRFIGAGEGIEDLRPFSSYEFVEALLSS